MQHAGSSSLTRNQTLAPALGVWSLSHWPTQGSVGDNSFSLLTLVASQVFVGSVNGIGESEHHSVVSDSL